PRLAQTVALDGMRKNNGRAALVIDGRMIGGIDFHRIVAAADQHLAQRLIRNVLDHLQQLRIPAEEVFAQVGAGRAAIPLIFAIDGCAKQLDEQPVAVAREELVPAGAPDDLDDVPASAAKGSFQFLNDLAIASDRTVKTLQVAIDDEGKIVEVLSRGE